MNILCYCTSLLCILATASVANAQLVPEPVAGTVTASGWVLDSFVDEESVGHGLPVLALDRKDWPAYITKRPEVVRAYRSINAEIGATHSTGWRIAAIARAEAGIAGNADALSFAELLTTNTDPVAARKYQLQAHGQLWVGQGIKLGLPWLNLNETSNWQWQADVQWLRLKNLKIIEYGGQLENLGADIYDFDIRRLQANPNIRAPFLPPSGQSGTGASVSIAMQGQPLPAWRVQVRADDLVSRLQWKNLATDAAILNSRVTSRAPDGTLNYAPLIRGQNSLQTYNKKMDVRWQAQIAWSVLEDAGNTGAVTLRADRKLGINQWWLGWDTGRSLRIVPRWSLEAEPNLRAMRFGLAWRGWKAAIATDAKGVGTHYRNVHLGWQGAL